MIDKATSTGYVTLGTESVPFVAVTTEAIECADPILYEDFADCNVPGGQELWRQGGFYSPGVCFVGYTAGCTETKTGYREGFPVRRGETAVKCVPNGYSCNTETDDQRYATSHYGAQVLSAPAFGIRWRQEDLGSGSSQASDSKGMSTKQVPEDAPVTTPSTTSAHHHTTASTRQVVPSSTETPSRTTGSAELATGHEKPINSGSIVGIAVGTTFAILAMAFTIVFCVLRSRRSREDRQSRCSDDFRSQGYPDVGLARGERQMPMELDSSPVEPKELAADEELSPARRHFPHPFRDRAKHVSINGQAVELPA